MISFDNVSKQFKLQYEKTHTLQDLFINIFGKTSSSVASVVRPTSIKILDGISFTAERGEVLGIIGPNGAGKSTILKLAARVISPDSGKIITEGRVAGLLELGTGFHPDLSGRENIYLYGSIMGLSRNLIEARLSKIIDFAELSHFIDVPVRDYSSGMLARLAFAVIIHIDAETLLVDEALSVGDAAFRRKSFQRILDHKAKGGTILFVSHDIKSIERLCNRVLLLQNGHIVAEGPPTSVINQYLRLTISPERNRMSDHGQAVQSLVSIRAVHLLDAMGAPCHQFKCGDSARLRIQLEANETVPELVVRAQIYSATGLMAHGTNTARHALSLTMEPGETWVEVIYQSLNLIPGAYYFVVGASPSRESLGFYDVLHNVCPFEINGSEEWGTGLALLPHRWQKVSI